MTNISRREAKALSMLTDVGRVLVEEECLHYRTRDDEGPVKTVRCSLGYRHSGPHKGDGQEWTEDEGHRAVYPPDPAFGWDAWPPETPTDRPRP